MRQSAAVLHPSLSSALVLGLEGISQGRIATDQSGRIVADARGEAGNQRLIAVSTDGSKREAIADDLSFVQDIAIDDKGNCFVAALSNSGNGYSIIVLPAADRDTAVPLRGGMNVSSIAVGPDGIVYYSTMQGEVNALEVDVAKAVEAAVAE